MAPSAVVALPPFLTVFKTMMNLAIGMERRQVQLIYLPIKAAAEFSNPSKQLPALRDRENATGDKIDGVVMTRSQRRRVGRYLAWFASLVGIRV
jgi:hypothetical protein